MMNLVESPSRPSAARGRLNRGELTPPSPSPADRAPESGRAGSGAYPAWEVFRALLELRHRGPIERHHKADRLGELCRMVCEMHRIEVELRGQLPRAPAIVVSNHLGYIDPLVLCSLIPLSPIAKSEICDWALVGVPLERLNVSFVRRGDPHSGARVLLRSLRALQAGVSVLNFPEGTTSRGGLLPFHLGAFWLSRKSGVPVVPVAIDFEDLSLCWVDRQAFLPHYAKVCWTGGPRRVRVTMAEPLQPARFRSELDLAWAARESIAQARTPYAPASPAAL